MTHKEKFQKTQYSKGWLDFVESAQFQSAADHAMLHLMQEYAPAQDMATAAANEWRRQGARRFLQILSELSLPPQKPPQRTSEGLDYKA